MSLSTTDVLHAASRHASRNAPPQPRQARLIVAGATGVLGNEVLRRLAGSGRFAQIQVLAKEPMPSSWAQVSLLPMSSEFQSLKHAPDGYATDVGVVMFEPPRMYYQRERTLWTPAPEQLLALAQWLRRCGAHTLVVVVPHAQGSLPDAVKRGLANLDEQALAAVGFERLLLVRSAQKSAPAAAQGVFHQTAAWLLSALSYMIPATELPVRPSKLAEFIDVAIHQLPVGTHVASPELLWQAAGSQSTAQVVQAWLNGAVAVQPHPTV